MADRLTQLQDAVNAQADNLCNSIGILQQTSQPSPLSGGKGGQPLDTDHTQLFAQMIARTGKDIEVSIFLPPHSQLRFERHFQNTWVEKNNS